MILFLEIKPRENSKEVINDLYTIDESLYKNDESENTKSDVIQSYVITDKEQKLLNMKKQHWCLIQLVSSLIFIIIIYIVFMGIRVCSKVPVEKTVEAQNYLKNIVTGKKLSSKDELYENLI